MTLFPSAFFTVLVYAAIGVTTGGAGLLIVLLLRDYKDGKLW